MHCKLKQPSSKSLALTTWLACSLTALFWSAFSFGDSPLKPKWVAGIAGTEFAEHYFTDSSKRVPSLLVRVPSAQRLVILDGVKWNSEVLGSGNVKQDAPSSEVTLERLAIRDSSIAAAVTLNYLKSFDPPIARGFVKISKRLVNEPFDSWLVSGTFCFDENNAKIYRNRELGITKSSLGSTDRWSNCFQAGPVLVINGIAITAGDLKEHYHQDDAGNAAIDVLYSDERTQGFICITRASQVVLGLIENIALSAMIELLPKSEAEGGLSCNSAMRLFSNAPAGTFVRLSDGSILKHGRINVSLPYVLTVK